MVRFSAIVPVAFAALTAMTGCATEAYQQPVQPSVHGRASLTAIPPSEPVPFTQPPPVAYNPPPPPAPAPQATTTTASNNPAPTTQVGPLPALPSQAPRYQPPPPPPPKVVYRSYPVYYSDYSSPYYYRPRSTFSIGVSSGPSYWGHRHYHRPSVGWGVGWGWGY